jgi:hypothetical protein
LNHFGTIPVSTAPFGAPLSDRPRDADRNELLINVKRCRGSRDIAPVRPTSAPRS